MIAESSKSIKHRAVQKEREIESERLLTSLDEKVRILRNLVDRFIEEDKIRLRVKVLVMNKNSIVYLKGWEKIATAERIYREIKRNPDDFRQKKPYYLQQLLKSNPELAEILNNLVIPSPRAIEFVKKLGLIVSRYPPTTISRYIRRYYTLLHQQLNIIGDNELRDGVERSLLHISQSEIDELDKCRRDVEHWTEYSAQFLRVDFFGERLRLYLNGGFDNRGNQEYRGLLRTFRDATIEKGIRQNHRIREMIRYDEQIRYFEGKLQLLERAIQSSSWKGFRGHESGDFLYDLKKGEKIIKKVREYFGNHEFASAIEEEVKIHENITAWMEFLKKRIDILRNPRYIERFVVHEVQKELTNLFTQRANDLQDGLTAEIKKLEKKLGDWLEKYSDRNHISDAFHTHIQALRSELDTKWERLTKKFHHHEQRLLEKVLNFIEISDQIAKRVDREKDMQKFQRYLGNVSNQFMSIGTILQLPESEIIARSGQLFAIGTRNRFDVHNSKICVENMLDINPLLIEWIERHIEWGEKLKKLFSLIIAKMLEVEKEFVFRVEESGNVETLRTVDSVDSKENVRETIH